jgi:hypothetical protein
MRRKKSSLNSVISVSPDRLDPPSQTVNTKEKVFQDVFLISQQGFRFQSPSAKKLLKEQFITFAQFGDRNSDGSHITLSR